MAGNWYGTFFDAMNIVTGDIHNPPYPAEEQEHDEGEDEFDEDEDEEDDDDDYEDEEDEEEEEEEDDVQVLNEIPPPPQPSSPNPVPVAATASSRVEETEEDLSLMDFEKHYSPKETTGEDIDGLFCPICMEPWSNAGDHQPSCLACGHLFGMSCIKKWLGQRRNSGKCPQCNKKCTLKDVRRIYGSQVVVVDEESQKRIRFLEAKCNALQKKDEEWRKKEVEWHMKVLVCQKKETELCQQLQQLNERSSNLERTLKGLEGKPLSLSGAANGFDGRSTREHQVGRTATPLSCGSFEFQQELLLNGARYFDVDKSGHVLIIARRPNQIGGSHSLTKMSLLSPREQSHMQLPSSIKAVRDLHFSSFGRLALLASLGKKLSVVSMESNNIVLNYDLPAAAWSCSWDINNPHYAHAGLQNGMLLVFDLRQTARPLESRNGLTCNPIHTILSLSDDSTVDPRVTRLLTASSVGLCEWNIGGANEQPSLIAETVNQGVCIALASDYENVVATFRPRVGLPDEIGSQLSQVPSSNIGSYVQGSHVFLERTDSGYEKLGSTSAYVPGIRLPKYAVLRAGAESSLFVSGDETTSNLVLQELPSLAETQRLKSHYPIRDVKYISSQKPGLLCCLSEDKMQFFTHNQF